MASTRSRPYTATTRPRETAREPLALAQIRQREPQARAPRAPRPVRRRVPPLVGEQEPQALPQARAQRERRVLRAPRPVRERVRRVPLAQPQVRQQERLRVPLQAPRVHEQGPPPATIPPQLAPEKRALQEQPPQAAIAPRAGTASFATRSPRASNYPTQAAPPGSFQWRLCWRCSSTGRP